jgi:predicted metal-dependent hydrolase
MTSLPPTAEPEIRASQALAAGREAFNKGQFFAAHELWEDAWGAAAGAPRTAMQGLIQIAAGLHHLQQDRIGPAARLLDKGARKLRLAAPDLRVERSVHPAPGSRAEPLADLLAQLKLDQFAVAITELVDTCTTGRPDPPNGRRSTRGIQVPRL